MQFHDNWAMDLNTEVVLMLRERANHVTGGNCNFADDDLAILAELAQRACRAGLTEGFDARVQENIRRRREERWA